uniref:Uncharacterized protein n=1 Tax=Arabidopsis thaliana TaxID=3702 RepID=Q0WMS6_ARATH|nr:hypothetical protein [Arabidopsis thaliana]
MFIFILLKRRRICIPEILTMRQCTVKESEKLLGDSDGNNVTVCSCFHCVVLHKDSCNSNINCMGCNNCFRLGIICLSGPRLEVENT